MYNKCNHHEEVFAVQFGVIEPQESVAPLWIASVCTHRVKVWGRLIAAFQRWVIYTAAVPQCAVLNSRAPCLTADKHKLFLSRCIYGFSHTILLVQPKPYKDIQIYILLLGILVNQIEWLLIVHVMMARVWGWWQWFKKQTSISCSVLCDKTLNLLFFC